MSQWASRQPKDGDSVALCEHKTGPRSWYFAPGKVKMSDGCCPSWINVCPACDERLIATGRIALVRCATWMGDAPIIESPS